MKWTTPRIVIVAVGAVGLATCLTGLTLHLLTRSSGSVAHQNGLAPSQGPNLAVQGQPSAPQGRGMTLRIFPVPDSQALEDLQSKVKSRQDTVEISGAITVSLKKYVNCKLTDPLADRPQEEDHNLAELPAGVHTYGGVPFDVQGIVQLIGGSIRDGSKLWPMEVPNIALGHSCKKIHLLNGAFNILSPRGHIPFAKLVLHFGDGSQDDLEFVGGTQTLRCVDAQVPQELDLLESRQTELAWIGNNAYLKKNNPTALLHLYRTTFANPKPDVAITAVDYVSEMGNPGPFLAGLTLE